MFVRVKKYTGVNVGVFLNDLAFYTARMHHNTRIFWKEGVLNDL